MAVARTYGKLERTANRDWKLSDVPPNVAIRLKQIFPRIPKTDPGPWTMPDTVTLCADLDWFISRYPMAMSPGDRKALKAGRGLFETQQSELEHILTPDFEPPEYVGLREGKDLRGYQKQSLEVLRRRKSQLCGDVTGLGKTFTAAGACLLSDALPAVITVEPHVQEQWCRRLETFTTLRVHTIKTTQPYPLPPADVYLFRYSNIAGWTDVLASMQIGLAAWDEIQQLRKGLSSQKGQASEVIAKRAVYRLGLTATPVYNYGREIFDVMRFIEESVLGSRGDFEREWLRADGSLVDPDALGSYLREQHVFIRRTRRDVGRELPRVNVFPEWVSYDRQVVASADELARQLALTATTGSFTERGQATRELDILMRHRTGVAKAASVADFVCILLESGEPVVLAGWHRDVYDIWLDKLADFAPAMYTGSETQKQKAESERRFLSGETDLLIISLRSGAGLDTLQYRSKTLVFGELDWSPGVHHQLIKRLDRDREDGEVNHVMAIYLVVDEGSDPPMMEVHGIKASEAAGVVDPGHGVQTVNSSREGLRALVRKYLSDSSRRGIDKRQETDIEAGESSLPAPQDRSVQSEFEYS